MTTEKPRIGERIRAKIIEAVSLNRLTIIVGPTGCGKSTLIPPLLLDGLKGRILCSQPRRLAVVAISKRVAEERGVTLGGSSVGYHVGNHNMSTHKTELLFTTAGILLEELRNNGVQALSKFECVIIDECHERSPESDLVLALVKQFIQTHPKEPIRLVLMSATFNHQRYANYFRNVPGCSTIDTITLETMQSFTAWHAQVQMSYLDDLKDDERFKEHKGFIRDMFHDADKDLHSERGKNLSSGMLSLIRSLVSHLDAEEPKESPFLIFSPTYRHLEQLYMILSYVNGATLEISVLHSAVDIEDCIRTMSSHSHIGTRRVLLASAIADSSVTVPGVSCVIDLCRALEVRWDVDTRSYAAHTVWCSKSIAEQRKGRTGRTCPGRVFRLVTRGFYINNLEQWDVPQLQMSSCHNEVLAMVCADEKLKVGDPRKVFQQCLDAPDEDAVDDAIDYLIEIGACHEARTGLDEKLVPTDYGNLMAALPMSVTEARTVLEGGRLGLLHETLALMAIYNHRPAPVVHHFSETYKNQDILESFYPAVQANSAPSVAFANLSAYMYWDHIWYRQHNNRSLRDFAESSRVTNTTNDPWKWTAEVDAEHIDWCKANDVNPTSMRSVCEIIESTINSLYLAKYEPTWLRCSDPTPRWKRPNIWKESYDALSERDMLNRVYGRSKALILCDALAKLAVTHSARSALPSVRRLNGGHVHALQVVKTAARAPVACVYFLMGKCKYGENCRQSHSRHARRPPCRFFQSGDCAKGSRCIFSHDDEDEEGTYITDQSSPSEALMPALGSLSYPENAIEWFEDMAETMLLLGEGSFQFTKSLVSMGHKPLATSTIVSSAGWTPADALVGVDATRLHCNRQVINLIRDAYLTCFAWNFPFTGKEEDALEHESLILKTFQSLTILFLENLTEDERCDPVMLGLTLQGDQFSRWNVTRSAWRTGWRLTGWCPFDHHDFPGYHPCRQNGDKFPVDKARLYVFECDVSVHKL